VIPAAVGIPQLLPPASRRGAEHAEVQGLLRLGQVDPGRHAVEQAAQHGRAKHRQPGDPERRAAGGVREAGHPQGGPSAHCGRAHDEPAGHGHGRPVRVAVRSGSRVQVAVAGAAAKAVRSGNRGRHPGRIDLEEADGLGGQHPVVRDQVVERNAAEQGQLAQPVKDQLLVWVIRRCRARAGGPGYPGRRYRERAAQFADARPGEPR
jgi:hypothetical protein